MKMYIVRALPGLPLGDLAIRWPQVEWVHKGVGMEVVFDQTPAIVHPLRQAPKPLKRRQTPVRPCHRHIDRIACVRLRNVPRSQKLLRYRPTTTNQRSAGTGAASTRPHAGGKEVGDKEA